VVAIAWRSPANHFRHRPDLVCTRLPGTPAESVTEDCRLAAAIRADRLSSGSPAPVTPGASGTAFHYSVPPKYAPFSGKWKGGFISLFRPLWVFPFIQTHNRACMGGKGGDPLPAGTAGWADFRPQDTR
jgi:hypothetical protein